MKIKLHRIFKYAVGPGKEVTLEKGIHTVSDEVGKLALKWGKAERLMDEKKAPENKLAKGSKNKAGVGRKTKRRGRPRSKPDA